MNNHFRKLSSFGLIFLFSLQASAQSLTFWGTRHAVFSSDPNNACEKQQDLLSGAIQKNPKAFPNLIFGMENVKPADKTEKLISVEDEVLRDYLTLYVITRSIVARIDDDIRFGKLGTIEQYGELVANYFRYIGDQNFHPDMAPFGTSTFFTDINKPYFKVIEGDFQITQPGMSGQKLVTAEKLEKPGLLNAAYEGSPDNLPSIMDSYLTLSLKVATAYYDTKLAKNTKYNIDVNTTEPTFPGKKIFDIKEIRPTSLFNKQNLLSKSHSYKIDNLSRYWRNHFIVANTINLMKKNPNKDILVWLGVNHISGVKNMISKTSLLTKEQKNKIKYLTPDTSPDIACSYTSVLSAIKDSRR